MSRKPSFRPVKSQSEKDAVWQILALILVSILVGAMFAASI